MAVDVNVLSLNRSFTRYTDTSAKVAFSVLLLIAAKSPPLYPPIPLGCLDLISLHFSIFAFCIGLWLSYATVHLNSPLLAHVISFPICANVCERESLWVERTAGAIFSVVSTVVLESCCAQDITALNQEEKFTSVSVSENTKNRITGTQFSWFSQKLVRGKRQPQWTRAKQHKELSKQDCAL